MIRWFNIFVYATIIWGLLIQNPFLSFYIGIPLLVMSAILQKTYQRSVSAYHIIFLMIVIVLLIAFKFLKLRTLIPFTGCFFYTGFALYTIIRLAQQIKRKERAKLLNSALWSLGLISAIYFSISLFPKISYLYVPPLILLGLLIITKGVLTRIPIQVLLIISIACYPRELFSSPPTQKVVIKEIRIINNNYTSSNVIKAMLYFHEGQRVEVSELHRKVQKSERRLGDSWYFYDSNCTLLPQNHPDSVTVLIDVNEGFLWRFNWVHQLRSVSLARTNLNGAGNDLQLLIGASQRASFSNNYLLQGKISFQALLEHRLLENYLENEHIEREWINYSRTGGLIGLGYNFDRDNQIRVYGEYYYYYKFTKKFNPKRQIIYGLEYIRDVRDDRKVPRSGYLFRIGYKRWTNNYGFNIEHRHYINFGSPGYLILNFQWGMNKRHDFLTDYRLQDNIQFISEGNFLSMDRKYYGGSIQHRFLLWRLYFLVPLDIETIGTYSFGQVYGRTDLTRKNIVDSFGIGLNLQFYAPVYLNFKVVYLFSRYGSDLFVDSVSPL